jgi:hypothetical protein
MHCKVVAFTIFGYSLQVVPINGRVPISGPHGHLRSMMILKILFNDHQDSMGAPLCT